MDRERFSLLLLEPNEIYFEDFSVELLPDAEKLANYNSKKVMGHLKLCSKSLVFDPKEKKLPLLKIPFKNCLEICTSPGKNPKDDQPNLVVRCLQYIKMLENNIIAPFEFIWNEMIFRFSFHYVNIDDYFLQLCQQLHRASSLHASEQNDMIASIVFSRHNRTKFNPLWQDSIYEETLYECKVDEIKPLILNPGKLVLTDSCIYFQPYNNIQRFPVIKINLSTIVNIIKRRFLLRYTGLEIKWEDNKHIYVLFRNVGERNVFCDLLAKQPAFNISNDEPQSMTLKWQNRLVSNYDYLLYLNSLADRTIEDLTQYPVFPWIITDYTSDNLDLNDERIYRDLKRPIGALNPERLQLLKERYQEMGDPKFLYGSHYSAPGLVLFYLVRKYPHLMLCLQNGRFDHPDRMFNNLSNTFHNCLNNMSDFKELIPEFYNKSESGDFLLNSYKINFGVRCDGTSVNHVVLPPWAKNSPELFTRILSNALESDYVSKNLNHWIDLIFGYKQRGEEAMKADNLFYHLCYEGSVDLDTVKDANARHALEIQISEFGQIPKQLFNKPHVSRYTMISCQAESPKRNSFGLNMQFELELQYSYLAHKEPITSISVDEDCIISTGRDGVLKLYNIVQQRQIRNLPLGSVPLSACLKIANSSVLIIASWDDSIILYNCDYGRISEIIPAHDDTVSSLCLIDVFGILISGSWDCTVKVWKGFTSTEYKTFRMSESMIGCFTFEEKIVCLESKNRDRSLQLVAGTAAGEIYTWEMDVQDVMSSKPYDIPTSEPKILVKHRAEITSIEFNANATKLASCSIDGSLFVTDVITGMNLLHKSLERSPTSLTWYNEFEFLIIGDEYGGLSIWDLMEGNLKCNINVSNGDSKFSFLLWDINILIFLSFIQFEGPLTCIKYDSVKRSIITAGKEKNGYQVKSWMLN